MRSDQSRKREESSMTTISEYLGQDHRCCDKLFEQVERSVTKSHWDEAEAAFSEFDNAMQRQIRALLVGISFTLKERDAVGFDGHAETLNILLQQHNLKEEGMLYPLSD